MFGNNALKNWHKSIIKQNKLIIKYEESKIWMWMLYQVEDFRRNHCSNTGHHRTRSHARIPYRRWKQLTRVQINNSIACRSTHFANHCQNHNDCIISLETNFFKVFWFLYIDLSWVAILLINVTVKQATPVMNRKKR